MVKLWIMGSPSLVGVGRGETRFVECVDSREESADTGKRSTSLPEEVAPTSLDGTFGTTGWVTESSECWGASGAEIAFSRWFRVIVEPRASLSAFATTASSEA